VFSEQNDLDPFQSLLGIRVLLVEDEPDIQALLVFILETAGAEVVALGYAEIALRRLESRCPDILLCNVRLPLEDGYWLIRQIRTHACVALRELPAIALTSYTRDVSEVEAFNAGFDLFLVIAVAILFRTFLWTRGARPQKCPCPNRSGGCYKFESSIADEILHLLSTHHK
jgi:CheY-like chemotaxis protein